MYIYTASKVNRRARGLRDPCSGSNFLNSNESMMYVLIDWATGCNFTSTHLPMGLVMPPQSEQTDLVGTYWCSKFSGFVNLVK